ncbi:MAG: hypothetical protein PHQ93_07905 [Sulfurimonas sp.]|uniref:hypothetical protein n=1 Tax=Sulfurimonas sp. TaxID=2022749 RepID=UPI00263770A3|nr:hypothetical protein [Sulfurimonas sp.]MDD5401093.1 hypothetical protein [Sulfurimonas sp.]
MKNVFINTNIPTVDNFPKDDKLRVVWAYGAVYKNTGTTRVPEIYVMLKEIDSNGAISSAQIFRRISVAQLDIVRYMTIWKGNRRTTDFWKSFDNNYVENQLFFLDANTATSISFTEKRKNTDYGYFPPYRYKIDKIDNPKDYYSFANATFTKIEAFNGITVIVPSMELLTSTYVPQEQQIRYKLIQRDLDDVLDEYIKSSSTDGSKYIVELYERKNESNISFLAYAKFNLVTRQRLKKLRASIETGSPYPERYPVVLPYHPSELYLQGDGIWLDEETFFMFRINQYSLPIDNEIESYTQELEFETDESKKENRSYVRVPQNLDDNEIPVTNEHNPHGRNAAQHIISEVSVLNPNNGSIKHRRDVLNIPINNNINIDIDIENTEDINQISSAQSDQATDSKNTAGIIIDEQDKSHLKQSEVLGMVIDALEYIRDNAIDISSDESNLDILDILFVDEECGLSATQTATQFSRVLKKAKKETNLWVKKRKIQNHKTIFLGFRNYMLIKVVLSNGKYAYLFEIDRKDENESFLGMIFNVGGEIHNGVLVDLLYKIMEEQGVVKKVKLSGLKTITFRHQTNKEENLNDNIQSALKKAIKNGLFS